MTGKAMTFGPTGETVIPEYTNPAFFTLQSASANFRLTFDKDAEIEAANKIPEGLLASTRVLLL